MGDGPIAGPGWAVFSREWRDRWKDSTIESMAPSWRMCEAETFKGGPSWAGGIRADVPLMLDKVAVRTDSSSLCCCAKESERAAIASSTLEEEGTRPGGGGSSATGAGGGVAVVGRGPTRGESSSVSLSLAGLLRVLGGGAPDLL